MTVSACVPAPPAFWAYRHCAPSDLPFDSLEVRGGVDSQCVSRGTWIGGNLRGAFALGDCFAHGCRPSGLPPCAHLADGSVPLLSAGPVRPRAFAQSMREWPSEDRPSDVWCRAALPHALLEASRPRGTLLPRSCACAAALLSRLASRGLSWLAPLRCAHSLAPCCSCARALESGAQQGLLCVRARACVCVFISVFGLRLHVYTSCKTSPSLHIASALPCCFVLGPLVLVPSSSSSSSSSCSSSCSLPTLSG